MEASCCGTVTQEITCLASVSLSRLSFRSSIAGKGVQGDENRRQMSFAKSPRRQCCVRKLGVQVPSEGLPLSVDPF